MADQEAVYRSLHLLFEDARAGGFWDAGMAYGWSLIRMNNEKLDAQLAQYKSEARRHE